MDFGAEEELKVVGLLNKNKKKTKTKTKMTWKRWLEGGTYIPILLPSVSALPPTKHFALYIQINRFKLTKMI